MKARFTLLCVLTALLLGSPAASVARDAAERHSPAVLHDAGGAAYLPYLTHRVHRVGEVRFSVGNWGFVGSQGGGEREACFNLPAPSFEYPKHSNINYLYAGAIWVGAVKDGDTLVSVGFDGWTNAHEFYPQSYPNGDILERTTRPILRAELFSGCQSIFFTPEAISEQDLVAVYADTLRDPTGPGGSFTPLGLEVTQESYAWARDYANRFTIINWQVKNAGQTRLEDVRLGLFVDADVGHTAGYNFYDDDICGYVRTAPSIDGLPLEDTLSLAWATDNDGDPENGVFDEQSPTAAMGIRMLRTPTGPSPASFNWWVSDGAVARDWGPNRLNSGIVFPRGNLGTPETDRNKYKFLNNGEFDYDQMETVLDHQADGWLPPPSGSSVATGIASGKDIRMLFGAEQVDLDPGASLPLTVAFVVGPNVHRDPMNFASNFNPFNPSAFRDRLDFTDLVRNARWAGWVFDNPGRDTDGNGYKGEYVIVDDDTLYRTGDGVPDYRGPEAPPPVSFTFETSPGRIVTRWNSFEVERARDPFTHTRDWEGFRVYISRSMNRYDFAMVAERDRVDFVRHEYEPIGKRWRIESQALLLDSLALLYDSLTQVDYGYPFDPDSFTDTSLASALVMVTADASEPGVLDTSYYAFSPVGPNYQVDDVAAYYADSAGANIVRVIRKPYPFAAPDDTMWREDGTSFLPYYEYEYAIDGLYPNEPVYVAVTAFDFGDPPSGVGSTEGDVLANAREVWPVSSGVASDGSRLEPGVFPNPYRVMDDYVAGGYEQLNPDVPNPEFSRQMTFYNLPDTCTVSIWTLDGDLVRELRHAAAPGSPQASIAAWDLINRNNDIITYGLYIYSIESSSGTFVGKLAIIR